MRCSNMNLIQNIKTIVTVFFLILPAGNVFLQNDKFENLSQSAENAFLSGDIEQAADLYVQLLEYDKPSFNESDILNRLKVLELLSLCLQQIGNCDQVSKYLSPALTYEVDKIAVARAIREMIRCHNSQRTKIDPNLQEQILSFFEMDKIDQNAHDQLSVFLSDPYTDEQDFSDFFLLFEYGFIPALKSMETVQAANEKARQRTWLAVISLFLLIGLGFILFTVKRQKDHIQRENVALLTGKEKESNRLSVDLHDILGYKIVELKDQVNKLQSDEPEKIQEVAQGLDQLHESMRYIVQSNLTPESLKFGLGAALETLFNRLNSLGVVRFNLYKRGLDDRLKEDIEKHIFYIIQELANNIIKHSKGQKASFEISKRKEEITILVEDDGIGYSPSIDTLKTVKSRVGYLNGKVIEESVMDKGTTIIVNIPV